jgi:type IV secretion system protein VirB6
MTNFTLFKSLSDKFIAPFNDYIGVTEQLIGMIMPLIVLVLTITIMWHGFETFRGKGGQNAFLDTFANSMRTMLVVGLGLTGGAYIANVVGIITELQNELTNIFAGTAAGSDQFQLLDASMAKVMTVYGQIWDEASQHINISIVPGVSSDFTGVLMIIQGSLMALFLGLYALTAALELTGITLILKILFAVGPIFVGLFAFQATAKFFDAWLGMVLKVAFTSVVISMMLGLGNGIFSGYAQAIEANVDTLELITIGFSSILSCVFLIVLIKKVPEMAAGMLGGIALSSTGPGVAGPLQAIGNMAAGAAGGAARGAAHMAGNTATGAGVAGKVAGAAERFSNSGTGHLMRAVAGGNGGVGKAFQAGANRHTGGIGSITNGRPLTPPI